MITGFFKRLRILWESNTILLIGATILSGVLCGLIFSSDNLFLLFLPPVLWSIALSITEQRNLQDRGYGYFAFTALNFFLWLLICVLAALYTDTFQSSPFSTFSLLGAFGAMCSYWLFAKIILDHYDYKYLILCFALGYLAITICQLQGRDNVVMINKRNLFAY